MLAGRHASWSYACVCTGKGAHAITGACFLQTWDHFAHTVDALLFSGSSGTSNLCRESEFGGHSVIQPFLNQGQYQRFPSFILFFFFPSLSSLSCCLPISLTLSLPFCSPCNINSTTANILEHRSLYMPILSVGQLPNRGWAGTKRHAFEVLIHCHVVLQEVHVFYRPELLYFNCLCCQHDGSNP